MKKLLLILMFSFGTFQLMAQEDASPEKDYKNEIGVDASFFLRQFLLNQYQYYVPLYQITYRRYFKPGNLRLVLGGNFSETESISDRQGITNITSSFSYYMVNTKVGWEFYSNIGKRFQVFYGIDFRNGYQYNKSEINYQGVGYENGSESKIEEYGIAPLLGFRFRINNRLSLFTETSYIINWQKQYQRNYYRPLQDSLLPIPDEISRSKSFSNYFEFPFVIYFAFNF